MNGRILLVDDEEHIRAAIAEYFTTIGYAVDCAADARTACALLDQRVYGVVITDLRLSQPDRFDGLGVLERARERQPAAPCIVLTAHGQPQSEDLALEAGASVFLQKPTPLEELAAIVAALVNPERTVACPG